VSATAYDPVGMSTAKNHQLVPSEVPVSPGFEVQLLIKQDTTAGLKSSTLNGQEVMTAGDQITVPLAPVDSCISQFFDLQSPPSDCEIGRPAILPTAIIVFREVLEAALIVGILMVASRGAPGRGLWVSGGIAAGVAAALVVALFAATLAEAAEGTGQELFDAGILLATVGMLGWHNIWMSRFGLGVFGGAMQLGTQARWGTGPLLTLAFAAALAVLREGLEVVFFLSGVVLAGQGGPLAMLVGGTTGLALGVAVGAAIYWGLARVSMRFLFKVTSWLLILLAAGLASHAAAFLMQAELLPPLGNNLWDTSFLLSEYSLPGRVLHTLIGYSAQPAGIQLVFYVVTLLTIGALMRLIRSSDRPAEANRCFGPPK
jgi:high-affinity iron transporter